MQVWVVKARQYVVTATDAARRREASDSRLPAHSSPRVRTYVGTTTGVCLSICSNSNNVDVALRTCDDDNAMQCKPRGGTLLCAPTSGLRQRELSCGGGAS